MVFRNWPDEMERLEILAIKRVRALSIFFRIVVGIGSRGHSFLWTHG